MVLTGTESRTDVKKSLRRPAPAKPGHSPLEGFEPRQRCILEAAYEVLIERGYAGASTLEIARRARVSKRELYAEFGSKAGILRALIASTASRMQLPLATAEIGSRAELAAALSRYGTTALAELTSPAVLAINRLAIAEAGRSSEMGRILEANGREPNRRALIALVAGAQSAGLLSEGDPQAIAGQFFSLLMGDLMNRLLLGVAKRPDKREITRRAAAATAAVLALHAGGPAAAAAASAERRPAA
jgi:AcrR family transcriptional regulator